MEGSDPVVGTVAAAIGDGLLATQVDQAGHTNLIVDRESILQTARLLRDGEDKYVHLSSVCGVDYLEMGLEPRFAVVYHLYSPSGKRRLTIKVPVEESDPVVPSVVGVFPTANWHERETWDMFGIVFEGHPGLTRILTPDDWVGHPLRKDSPLGDEEVQFSHNPPGAGSEPGGKSEEAS